MKLLGLVAVALVCATTSPAPEPRLIGAFDVVVERSGTLLVADMSNRIYRARGRKLTVVARVRAILRELVDSS